MFETFKSVLIARFKKLGFKKPDRLYNWAGFLSGIVFSFLVLSPFLIPILMSIETCADMMIDWKVFFMELITIGLLVPVWEEFVFRGVLWEVVEDISSSVIAAVFITILFIGFHNDSWIHIVAVTPISIIMGILRCKSGSIYPSIIAHITYNTFIVMLGTLINALE